MGPCCLASRWNTCSVAMRHKSAPRASSVSPGRIGQTARALIRGGQRGEAGHRRAVFCHHFHGLAPGAPATRQAAVTLHIHRSNDGASVTLRRPVSAHFRSSAVVNPFKKN